MELNELILSFEDVKSEGNGYRARCPVHGGHSLLIDKGETRSYVLKCMGCDASFKEIMDAAGLSTGKASKGYPKLKIRQPKKIPTKAVSKNILHWFITSWNEADQVESHPYLDRKGVDAIGIRVIAGNTLLLPVWKADNKLHGLQSIYPDGEKKFWAKTHASGGFFYLTANRSSAHHVWIAEGYATAATVAMCCDAPVVCCFSAGNVGQVAEALKRANPAQRVYLAADHDAAGLKAARDCKSLDYWAAPTDEGLDWNDYYQAQADDALIRTEEELYAA